MSDEAHVRSDDQEKSDRLVDELREFLVPIADTFQHRGTTLAGYRRSVAECGGDWWTARALPDGKLLVLIADVMGHDLDSAIIMGVGKAVCDLACVEADTVHCTELLTTMNESIFEAGSRGKITMTCFVSVVDPRTRSMSFASAGHPQPLLLRQGPQGSEPHVLRSLGTPLGFQASASYQTRTMQLEPGDLLFWYTDGVTECRNPSGKRLSERRLARLLCDGIQSPLELRDQIAGLLDTLHQDRPPDDDITFVLARIG